MSRITETGYRHTASGDVVPRDIITSSSCRYNGTEIFCADLYPAIAANPFITFFTTATESGTFEFEWIGDLGHHAGPPDRLPDLPAGMAIAGIAATAPAQLHHRHPRAGLQLWRTGAGRTRTLSDVARPRHDDGDASGATVSKPHHFTNCINHPATSTVDGATYRLRDGATAEYCTRREPMRIMGSGSECKHETLRWFGCCNLVAVCQ